MTEFTIRYHELNDDKLGECKIEVPNETVDELLDHFRVAFGEELLQGEIRREEDVTHIQFKASKQKLQALERTIVMVLDGTARLN